jgi:hypothetical protein
MFLPSHFTILHAALSIKQQQHQNPNCLVKLEMYFSAHYFSSLFDGFFLCQHASLQNLICHVVANKCSTILSGFY